ncbi:hypothetical protein RND81_06G204500 [Saponaria officinalis]|uniref:HMA domain-containing protein n=1 Tax=Saponaria officinalis TaxID=3572 RepID=A0AAW1K945_SAPOF
MLDISSYTSQTSTPILSSNMDIPSSSSSSSSTFVAGGRALDRHNPIITDEKRSGISSDPTTPLGTPRTNHVLQCKPKSPFSPNPQQLNSPTNTNIKNNNKSSFLKMTKNTAKNNNKNPDDHDHDDDLMTKAVACDASKPNNNVDYVISPPESSRYLLDEDNNSFLDGLSGFDPVSDKSGLNNDGGDLKHVEGFENDGLCKSPKDCSSSSMSEDQVVVLRVSLHCRGCERKMKKHLSKMSGVTSYNVDFIAKKVTVVGDVTPLQVLANISKVKTAKLWSPPTAFYPNIDTINTQLQN